MPLALDLALVLVTGSAAVWALRTRASHRRDAQRAQLAAERAVRAATLAAEDARHAREERDHLRARLDAGDARWHALARGAPLGIVESDETGRVVAANDEAMRLLRGRLVGEPRPLDGEREHEGTWSSVTHEPWPEGELAFVRDVTHERTTDAELRESEARFRRLSETAFEGVAVVVEGKVRECNARFAAILDRSADDAVGVRATNLLTPETRGALLDAMLVARETPFELVALREDGSTVPLEAMVRRMPMHGRDVLLLGVRDITVRKKLIAELDALRAQLPGAVAERARA